MATDPLLFLEIANRYKSSVNEYERRTAIGRAYYAVYNFVCDKLQKEGVQKFKNDGGDHDRMVYFLTNCNDPEAGIVGNLLKNLKATRKSADYRMDLLIDKRNSELAHDRALKAVEGFKKLSGLPKLAAIMNRLGDPPHFRR
jgi:hypothetical protein